MKLFAPLSLTFRTPFAPFSVGVTVTLSPVLSVNSVWPSVPVSVSAPYVTVYVLYVCVVLSYDHSLLRDSTARGFVSSATIVSLPAVVEVRL